MSARTKKKTAWPLIIKSGSVRVKIYRTHTRGYPMFTVAHHLEGKRKLEQFADLGKARKRAQEVAHKIQTGEQHALSLTNQDKAEYVTALDTLKLTGKSLPLVAAEYAEAWNLLKNKGTLADAARYFVRHQARSIPQKTVPEIVTEMLEAKKTDGLSELYLKDLRWRLKPFAEAFGGWVSNILSGELDDWLRSRKVGPKTRNNFRNAVVTLFNFAKQRGYLPKDRATEAEGLAKAKERHGEVGILTPDQMNQLLNAADFEVVPFIAIGGFAGLRHWELLRLVWEEVNFTEGHIMVSADKAKTAQRRIVPIQPNLAAWLKPYRKMTGRVCPQLLMIKALNRLSKKVKLVWPKNALRHSYGSYRLAWIQDAAKTSFEMGNSPRMVFSSYREVVTEKQAKAWFDIYPKPLPPL
jgi:integrase